MAGGNVRTTRARQPITRHPLFPAVAALWFGALFGLGSLAIRVTLLESTVVASGIDLIVPAAAPPLGVTARILLALLTGSFGSLIGYALGTRIARPRIEPAQRRRTTLASEEPPLPRRADRFTAVAAEAPRPLSAFEELDQNDRIAPPSAPVVSEARVPGSRRRALAMAEPQGPDYGRDHAPLPGSDYLAAAAPQDEPADVLDLCDALSEPHPVEALLPDDQSFVPFAQPAARAFDQNEVKQAAMTPSATIDLARFQPTDEADEPFDDRDLPPRNLAKRFAAPQPANEAGAAPLGPGGAEPAAAPPAAVEPLPDQPAASPAPAAPLWSAATARSGSASGADHLRSAPLDSLSQIELIERLALSLHERRAAAAAASVASPAPIEAPAAAPQGFAIPPAGEMPRFGFEPRTPVEIDLPPAPAAAATAPAAAPASPLPAAMRPIDVDSDFDDDGADAAPVLPRFPFAAPSAGPVQAQPAPQPLAESDPEDSGDESLVDDSFSSLLDLGRAPLRQPLVRIEEPADETSEIEPVVVFPGHGSRPFAAPAPAPAEPEPAPPPLAPGARPFDAPTAAAPATPQAAAAASRQDSEETERALRAALATLQRMSGAA